MKPSRVAVGMAVRALREAAQLSSAGLAAVAGVHPSSLSRTENGLRDLGFAEAVAISAATKVNLGVLGQIAACLDGGPVAEMVRQKAEAAALLDELTAAALDHAVAARQEG
ncbi:helix-turn-helix domain-containing protein [Caldimonas brevitalea]|uniref:HTH cro/C1-type domain-containing protein n=1 Tax=Caldimonas brevitalea TaxID=413882 RepID=A0A0G3BN91_9BURK|nr:helix-turn-helix transcriptional regulator [Caldimonas brevitalea]AKJ28816.1 hypothetical protein AAW51_2125 [Caldimonas brevitalea]